MESKKEEQNKPTLNRVKIRLLGLMVVFLYKIDEKRRWVAGRPTFKNVLIFRGN
jgi:hypothetical protein